MLLMDYTSIRGKEILDYAKKATWKSLHEYIDAYCKILISEYPGYEVQAISRLQSQCENVTFPEQSRYNKMFQKVVHKGGKSPINHINIFQNAKAFEISVGNSYNKYQLMHTFLDNCHQGGKYSAHI